MSKRIIDVHEIHCFSYKYLFKRRMKSKRDNNIEMEVCTAMFYPGMEKLKHIDQVETDEEGIPKALRTMLRKVMMKMMAVATLLMISAVLCHFSSLIFNPPTTRNRTPTIA